MHHHHGHGHGHGHVDHSHGEEPGVHDYVEANRRHHDGPAHAHNYRDSALNTWAAGKIADTILRQFNFDEDTTTVLDFACGPGLVSQKLAQHCKRIVGVDLSTEMVTVFNQTVSDHGIDPTEMVALQKDQLKDDDAELDGELFDVVFCAQAYHHIPDVNGTTLALSRRVKPGGVLLVLDLDSTSDWGLLQQRRISKKLKEQTDAVVAHKGGFSREDLTLLFEKTDRFSEVTVDVSHEMKLSEMQALKGKGNWSLEIDSNGPDLEIRVLVARGVRK